MKTDTTSILFVVLVPHKDAGVVLEKIRRRLFAEGFFGAFSFPPVIPLAALSRPLSDGELKSLAARLRLIMGDEKFMPVTETDSLCFPVFTLHGPAYKIPPLDFPSGIQVYEKAVFPVALTKAKNTIPKYSGQVLPEFRAAALATICIRASDCGERPYSLNWESGKPRWLAKPDKADRAYE